MQDCRGRQPAPASMASLPQQQNLTEDAFLDILRAVLGQGRSRCEAAGESPAATRLKLRRAALVLGVTACMEVDNPPASARGEPEKTAKGRRPQTAAEVQARSEANVAFIASKVRT